MSNGINQRQNEEKCVAMLAAQRQLYNDAKKLDWTSTVLSVLIPFLLSCILLFVSKDSPVGVISYIVSIVSMIFSFCVSGHIKNEKEWQLLFNKSLIPMFTQCRGIEEYLATTKCEFGNCTVFGENSV